MSAAKDVALILWNPDVITVMSIALLQRGVQAAGLEPREPIERIAEFIDGSNCGVVVFDLAPPYADSAAEAAYLMDRFSGRTFVFTCADPQYAFKSEPWLASSQIFGKPYDLADVADSIARGARNGPVALGERSIGAGRFAQSRVCT